MMKINNYSKLLQFIVIFILLVGLVGAVTLIKHRQILDNMQGQNQTNATKLSSALAIGIEMKEITGLTSVLSNTSIIGIKANNYSYLIVSLDNDGQ